MRIDLPTGRIESFLSSERQMTSSSLNAQRFVTIKRSAFTPEILVMGRDKQPLVRIPLPANPEGTPKLSRDGKLILVGDIVGDTKISSYEWMPDGRILFSRFGTLYIMETDFMTFNVYRQLQGTPNSLSISPDGSKVAFEMLMAGQSHIWVIEFGAGSLSQITTSTIGEHFPSWSPDNLQLVLAKGKLSTNNTPNCLELWVVNTSVGVVSDLNSEDLTNTFRVKQNVAGQISETCTTAAPEWRQE